MKWKIKLFRWRDAVTALLAVMVLLPLSGCVVRRMIFPGPQGDFSIAESIYAPYARTFDVNGVRLQGWFVEREGKPLRMICGGNATHASAYLPEAVADADCATLTVNYRGFGASEGSPSEKALVADALAVLDLVLAETKRTPGDVILLGESLGAGVASQVAAVRPVAKLLLLVPGDNMAEVVRSHVSWVPRFLVWDSFASDEAAAHIDCPVAIFAAKFDEVIPVKHARRLREAFKPEQAVYREYPASHNGLRSNAQFLVDFKKENRL